MRRVVALLALVVCAGAAPPPRAPAERQTLVDLAFTLGQGHALGAICRGPEDQVWRARMAQVLETEQPAEGLRRRLVDSFNAGYATTQAAHPACTPEMAAEERAAAAKGATLARRLAGP